MRANSLRTSWMGEAARRPGAAFFYPEANGCKICCPEAYYK